MTISERILDLSMIWKQASLVFPYFDKRNIDWDQAYREYLPKVMAAESDREFHLLLTEFMNLLGDGHTDYLMPKTLRDECGYLPFSLRFIRNVYCFDAISPIFKSFIGAELIALNGVPFSDLIERIKKYAYHRENYISRYWLHTILPFFLQSNGNPAVTTKGSFSFDLLPSKPDDFIFQTVDLQMPFQRIGTGRTDIRLYENGILLITLNNFLYDKAANEIRSVLAQMREISGIIFDLRDNIGGMTLYGAKIAELMIPGIFHGCKKRTRLIKGVDLASSMQILRWSDEAIERHIAAGLSTREEIEESKRIVENAYFDHYVDSYGAENHAALFTGPCVILTSRHTVSAAEDFITMYRTNHKAAVIGTEIYGSTGTPLVQKLSCGGIMRVCSVGYELMNGTGFIGCGIKPDIFCEMSNSDFQQGHDSVLKTAMEYIQGSHDPQQH